MSIYVGLNDWLDLASVNGIGWAKIVGALIFQLGSVELLKFAARRHYRRKEASGL